MFALYLDERPAGHGARVDYRGAALLVLGAGALMLALVQAGSLPGPVLVALAAAGGAALAILVRHERAAAAPLLPFRLWRDRVVVLGSLGGGTIGAVMMGVTAFLPTYVQGAMGRDAAVSGVILGAMSVSWTFASIAGGRLMVRTSYRHSAAVGGVALIAGSLVLVALEPARGPLWAGAGALLIGIGMGYCNTAFLVAVQASVGWSDRGAATASMLFLRMVGQSLGAALFGAVLNWGLARRLGAAGDAIDRLMEPELRRGLGAGEIARLGAAVAASLHAVYVIAALLALVALGLALAFPRGLSPTRPARRR
jgi:Na+/melibiose symporter-like transporter